MRRTPPPRELLDLERQPRRWRGVPVALVVVLLAGALAAAPQAASAQTSGGQQQESDTSALEAAIQARIDRTASRGDRHSNRIWRGALAAVQGVDPSGDAREVDAAFAQHLADNHRRGGRAALAELWQDIADALSAPPPPVIEPPQLQQEQQQDGLQDELQQNEQQQQDQQQQNDGPRIKFTQNGQEITELNVPAFPGVASYGVSLTARPTGNVTLLFLTDNFTPDWRNILIDFAAHYQGTARPNVNNYISGIHRAQCNQEGTEYLAEFSRVTAHNHGKPSHQHLQLPNQENYTKVCETIMTFTPANWDTPQTMRVHQKPRNLRVMTPPCTGLVDGRFPQQCNRDVIEHVAFAYDSSYHTALTKLNIRLAG